MELFYNHNWIPENVSVNLLLVEVPDPDSIKTVDDLLPYVKNDLDRLIEQEEHPARLIQDLIPELERYVIPGDSPGEIANLLLSSDLFSSNISRIREQANKMEYRNTSRLRPSDEELQEMYEERSLYLLIECLFRIY